MGGIAFAAVLGSPAMVTACLLSAVSGGALMFALLPGAVEVLLARVADRAQCSMRPGPDGGERGTARFCDAGAAEGSADAAAGGVERARAACALAFGAACGWAAFASCAAGLAGQPRIAAGAACWLAVGAAVLLAAACDLAARAIPRETCWAVGAAGALLQMVTAGPAALAAGALFGGAVAALCALCNRMALRRGRACAVGGGDVRCMAALSLASGYDAFGGFALCFSVAAACAVAGVATRRLHPAATVPLAPFFCLWAAFGAGSVWA